MYLLDTNHCSQIIFGNSNVITQSQKVGESKIATSAITIGELIYMAENSRYQVANLKLVEDFIREILIYNADSITGRIYGQLKAQLMNHFGPKDKKKRRQTRITDLGISENDLWIAAIALQHNCIVVSSDNDFLHIKKVEEFSLESWYIPP